ncbi:hypothetical protein [Magnetofaba australis]|uniref:Uncharacterized protein n=1 Tax=Magnetofaba australis IT-1 TaxID=1434232 RepID=A0A1Y2K9J8_9PROT|nr:hypothetical protein [Magnetofaba australis]OSM07167.1 hypothetical protein MAIT1_03912 [Magnetofaba australis IT-1]
MAKVKKGALWDQYRASRLNPPLEGEFASTGCAMIVGFFLALGFGASTLFTMTLDGARGAAPTIVTAIGFFLIVTLMLAGSKMRSVIRQRKRQGKPIWRLSDAGLDDVYLSNETLPWSLLGPALVTYSRNRGATGPSPGGVSHSTSGAIEKTLVLTILDWDRFDKMRHAPEFGAGALAEKMQKIGLQIGLPSAPRAMADRLMGELDRLAYHHNQEEQFAAHQAQIRRALKDAPALKFWIVSIPWRLDEENARDIFNAEFLRRHGDWPEFSLVQANSLKS